MFSVLAIACMMYGMLLLALTCYELVLKFCSTC